MNKELTLKCVDPLELEKFENIFSAFEKFLKSTNGINTELPIYTNERDVMTKIFRENMPSDRNCFNTFFDELIKVSREDYPQHPFILEYLQTLDE